MVTDEVIQEIYREYNKHHKDESELNLDYFLDLLKSNHNIDKIDNELVIKDLEEFNPFRRFLIRSLNAVLEFESVVAFVFMNHILFLGKNSPIIRVHIKPEEKKKSILGKIFGKK